MGFTALRDSDAGLAGRAPGEAGCFALASTTIVEIIGTVNGDADACLGRFAECEASFVGRTVSAGVMAFTTVGNTNTALCGRTPGEISVSAFARAAVVVVVGTLDGDGRASEGEREERVGAPGVRADQAQAVSTEVVELAADWHVYTQVGTRAKGLACFA